MDPSIPPLISSVLPILISAFAYLKSFLRPREAIREQVLLYKKNMAEKHALLHTELLRHVFSVGETDDVLRGDGREDRDLPGELSGITLKYAMYSRQLDFWHNMYKFAALAVFLGVHAGIVGILVVLIAGISAYSVVVCITIAAVILQLVLVAAMRIIEGKLDRYENIL